VAFLAGHLAGKTTFSPEQHPRLLDAGVGARGSGTVPRFFRRAAAVFRGRVNPPGLRGRGHSAGPGGAVPL